MSRRFVVGVMGPGDGADEGSREMARELGALVAAEGWTLLTGGRDAGVMGAANEGAKTVAGSITVGILPTAAEAVPPHVDIAVRTDLHAARNNVNVLSSDVVVACGNAGTGTVSEIALAVKNGRAVVLLGVPPDVERLFMRLGKDLVVTAATPAETIEAIRRGQRFVGGLEE